MMTEFLGSTNCLKTHKLNKENDTHLWNKPFKLSKILVWLHINQPYWLLIKMVTSVILSVGQHEELEWSAKWDPVSDQKRHRLTKPDVPGCVPYCVWSPRRRWTKDQIPQLVRGQQFPGAVRQPQWQRWRTGFNLRQYHKYVKPTTVFLS